MVAPESVSNKVSKSAPTIGLEEALTPPVREPRRHGVSVVEPAHESVRLGADLLSNAARARLDDSSQPATVRMAERLVATLVTGEIPGHQAGLSPRVADSEPTIVNGHYALEQELGHGGMGIVYLATDMNLHRRVALKMISPTLGRISEWKLGFHKEAVALASIRSQHVVQVYSFGEHDDSYFFAMEYVRGRSLRQLMDEHRDHDATIPVYRTLTILERLADGLDAVHATGLVHRDVKPANVVIEDETGRPVLVDFGLAVPSATTMEHCAGTPTYMAPEQSWLWPTHTAITPRVDVYALGCVAFEMLCGHLPFERDTQTGMIAAHMYEQPPAISSIRADLAPFDAPLLRALAKRPEHRYESCPEFGKALMKAGEIWQRAESGDVPPSMPLRARAPNEVRQILIVDDDPSFRRFATRAVQLAFYGSLPRISAADSGMAALASAAKCPPDLVLLDLDMPRLDGVDTLSRLRAMPYGERARVVVVSGKSTRESRWRFSVLGVSDFLDKPIDLETLVDRISAIASHAGWHDAVEPA